MKYFQQLDESDCGAACLTMVANHYRLNKSVTFIRELAGTDKVGTSLQGMVNAGEKLGFEVKAMEGDKESLSANLPFPFIVHVKIPEGGRACDHYILIKKITKKKIILWDPDPSRKKSKISTEDFLKIWTGYVLFFTPALTFKIDNGSNNTLLKFLPLLKPYVGTLVLAGIASMILVVLGILSSLYSRYIIDEVLFAQARTTLTTLSIGMICMGIIQSFIGLSRSVLLAHFSFKADLQLVYSYFSHVLRLPMSFFDSRKTGEILSRLSDAKTVKGALSSTALSVIMDVIMIVAIGPVLFFMNSTLFFITLITIPLISIIIFIFAKFYRKNFRELKIKGAELQSYLVEAVNGSATVKSLNAEQIVFEEYEKRSIDAIWTAWKTQKLGWVQSILSGTIQGVGGSLLFWFGSMYIMDEVFTLGTLISFTALSGYFTGPLQRMINLQATLQEAFVAADRLGEILELEVEQKDDNLLKPSKFLGSIDVKDVLFRYGSRLPVYESLNFSVAPGEWVAFVGPSGSGKTTLVKLLLKMYIPESGEILIDGHNVRDIDTSTLRGRVGYVPQDIFLFSGTVTENISLHKPDAKFEEIMEAAKSTGADEFIQNLPERYNTKLGERGASLSGGERQRIALARAILGNPDLIIFDEATSNLDTISEHFIHKTINSLKKKKITTIIIAHRLSTVTNCDKIFVLEKGNIIQKGTHKELLRKKGLYKSLWDGSTV